MVTQPRFMFSFASEIKSFHGGVDTCPGKLSNIGEDKKILSYHAVNSCMTVGQYPSGRSTNDPQFAKKRPPATRHDENPNQIGSTSTFLGIIRSI